MTQPQPVLSEKGLTVPLASGPAYFNAYWLRDTCPSTIDPQTRERIFDVSSLAAAPRAKTAVIDGDALVITWEEDPQLTRIPLEILTAFGVSGRAADPADLPRRHWYSDHHPKMTRVAQTEVLTDPAERARFLRALIEDGIAIVTDMEDSDESLFRLVGAVGPVSPSAEGKSFHVKLEIVPTNLAFTAGPLEMHTDLPGEENPPGVQFLHCRANTVEGGRSLYLDGVAVAEAFRAEDPEGFALLASYDIPFFYRHDNWDYRAHQRVIELDARGQVTGVTVSQHLQDAMDLPQQVLDDYYPAFCRFIRMMQDDRFLCRFRSNAGECIVFDNHRIVHGREAFSADSGQRHLHGCYSDRGALRSAYRMLAEKGYKGEADGGLKAAG